MGKRLVALLLLCAGFASADTLAVTRSSFTLTNDSVALSTTPANVIGVIVGGASTGGTLKIYNSTWTTGVQVSSISLATVTTHWFGDNGVKMSGIYYTTTSNTGGVTILYHK